MRARVLSVLALLIIAPLADAATQPAAGKPEATSLLGKPLYPIQLAPEAKKTADANLLKAREDYAKAPGSADAIIWLGRRLAAAGYVREAIDAYTKGIAKFPNDARFYRFRGHRYVSVREFDKAIADLTQASQLIAGKPDEPEPSTADPKVMSSETLHYAIYYHLGLAHYLKADFENALKVYRQCLAVAKGNDDQTVGVSDWLYMTLRRLNRTAEAAKALDAIVVGMKVKDDQQVLRPAADVQGPEDAGGAAAEGRRPCCDRDAGLRRGELVPVQRQEDGGEDGLREDHHGAELDAIRAHRGGGGTGADEVGRRVGRAVRPAHRGSDDPRYARPAPTDHTNGVVPGIAGGSTGFGPNAYFGGVRSSVDEFIAHSQDIARPV